MRISDLRFIFMLLAIVLAVSFVGVVYASTTPVPIVLKYGRIFPKEHWITKKAETPWLNLIQKRTKGRIKIEYYPNVAIERQLEDLKAGALDMGIIIPLYFSSTLPLTQVSRLPLIVDLDKFRNVTKAIFETNEIKKEWEDNNGCKPLLMIPTPGYHFWTKKPIKTLKDLSGIKIGTHPAPAKVVDALGAISVAMPTAEIYNALQKGTVDAVYTSTLSFKKWRFYELEKYGALFGAQRVTPFWCSINLNAWKKLPEDIKKIILNTTPEVEQDFTRFLINTENKSIGFLKQKGVDIYRLSPNEVKPLIDTVTKQLVNDWIKKSGDPGYKLLQQVEMKVQWPCFINPPACVSK